MYIQNYGVDEMKFYKRPDGSVIKIGTELNGLEEITESEYIDKYNSVLNKNNESPTGQPTLEPTPEERIAALEEELAATKILLGLEE